MKLKTKAVERSCGHCGQKLPELPVGTILYNIYREALAVIITPHIADLSRYPDKGQYRVMVLTGEQAGQAQNWCKQNVQVAHGHFHIDSREAAV